MLVGREGHGMKNMISSILKGIGVALGVILLALGGFMGIENVQVGRGGVPGSQRNRENEKGRDFSQPLP